MPLHPDPFTARWHGRWIWWRRPALRAETATRPVVAEPTDDLGLFRRVLDLDVVPERVPARLWVDGRHVLRVNGEEVARGPVRSDPRAARYDVVDLAPHLRRGRNVIAVLARHFADATSWWIPVPPTYSLGAGSLVFEALVGDEWVISDRTWRSCAGDAWTAVAVPGDVACLPLEHFDARLHPAGWDLPGFDDSSWRKAVEITALHTGSHGAASPPVEPFGMLLPPVRDVFPGGARHDALPVGRREVVATPVLDDPVRQVLADEAEVDPGRAVAEGARVSLHAFDLGRIAAGTVRLRVDGAAAGTVLDLAVSEHVDAAGRLVPLGQHAGLRYVCSGDPVESFESFDVLGLRHAHVVVRSPDA